MQTGKSLADLAATVVAQSAARHDFIAPTARMSVVADDKAPALVVENEGSYKLNSTAMSQIGEWAGIPTKYVGRMVEEAPALLSSNFNHWLRESADNRMIRAWRTGADTARAFLSDKFRRIDNDLVLSTIVETLNNIESEVGRIELRSMEVTERRLYIQAVFPRIEGEVARGDVVQAGVSITNSEIGYGAFTVSPLVFRLVCLNGLIMPDGKLRANHVGRRLDQEAITYQSDTIVADNRALSLKARDTILDAARQVTFERRVDSLRALTEGEKIARPVEAVKVLANDLGLTQERSNRVLESLIKGGDMSRWGVLNAITAQAHDTSLSYDDAYAFEQAGAKVLDLPRKEWVRIAEAA